MCVFFFFTEYINFIFHVNRNEKFRHYMTKSLVKRKIMLKKIVGIISFLTLSTSQNKKGKLFLPQKRYRDRHDRLKIPLSYGR